MLHGMMCFLFVIFPKFVWNIHRFQLKCAKMKGQMTFCKANFRPLRPSLQLYKLRQIWVAEGDENMEN